MIKILHPIPKSPMPPITSVPGAEKGIATIALRMSFIPTSPNETPRIKTDAITHTSVKMRQPANIINDIAKGTLIGAVKMARMESSITFFV